MKIKNNQSGLAHIVVVVLIVAVIAVTGFVGWKVWDGSRSKSKNEAPVTNTQSNDNNLNDSQAAELKELVPEGWVKYQDPSTNVSFYHPSGWEKSRFRVYRVGASGVVKGTNHGPYSAKYIFNKSESKWYAVNSEGKQVAPYSGYTTVTSTSASKYPVVYGYTGEGGSSSYYTVFTDGDNSYMIELPMVAEETSPNGLGEQKEAIADLVKTINLTD